jgi:uncharacterized protein YjbJ (UPF0337 family)
MTPPPACGPLGLPDLGRVLNRYGHRCPWEVAPHPHRLTAVSPFVRTTVRWTCAVDDHVRGYRMGIGQSTGRETPVGLDDTLGNKAAEASGKVEEGAGNATDDQRLEAKGKGVQARSTIKQAGENVKNVFS